MDPLYVYWEVEKDRGPPDEKISQWAVCWCSMDSNNAISIIPLAHDLLRFGKAAGNGPRAQAFLRIGCGCGFVHGIV